MSYRKSAVAFRSESCFGCAWLAQAIVLIVSSQHRCMCDCCCAASILHCLEGEPGVVLRRSARWASRGKMWCALCALPSTTLTGRWSTS